MHYAPTPIHPWMRFHGNEIYIKREDLLPFSFGGNKLRIADALFADMAQLGGDHIIAYGPPTSNLCRMIVNRAASRNLRCTILCGVDGTAAREGSNAALVESFGAELRCCDKSAVAQTVEAILEQSQRQGNRPYYIYGDKYGHGKEAVAAGAYAAVYAEIRQQEAALGLRFDSIYLACGTGMSYSGLLAGRIAQGGTADIIAISVARSREQAMPYLHRTLDSLVSSPDKPIHFIDDYRLDYGRSHAPIHQSIREALTQTGIALDPIYTGKAFWGMKEHILSQSIEGRNILFIHTGGTPLFFDHIKEIFA